MGLSLYAEGPDAPSCVGWSYSGVHKYRKDLLLAARAALGPAWEANVKFSWMLDDTTADPAYDGSHDMLCQPWWDGPLTKIPAWLPGLLAFVNKSDCQPAWSWGQCAEIALMLETLDPTSQALPVFKYAAEHRLLVSGA